MQTRNLIFILVTFFALNLWADQKKQVPNFLEVARSADGKVIHLTQQEADRYCKLQGARLPTARELAQLSITYGAKGFVDTCGATQNCIKIENIRNEDGGGDECYFNYSGYKQPDGDLGNEWLWSSSYNVSYPYTYVVCLYGEWGNVDYVYDQNDFAVRCIADAEFVSPIVKIKDLTAIDQKKYCARVSPAGGCYMWYSGAESYCKSIGKRLPTAKEWAQFASKNEAKGFLTEAEYNVEAHGSNWKKTYKIWFEGDDDFFYYSSVNYKDVTKKYELGGIIWSSTNAGNDNISFNPYSGGFPVVPIGNYVNTVSCVNSR